MKKKTTKKRPISVAEVKVLNVPGMTKEGRRRIAQWLRSRANYIEKHYEMLTDDWFTQRYMVERE